MVRGGGESVTIAEKTGHRAERVGRKRRRKFGKQRKEEMRSFLRKGAVTAICNRL